MAMVRVVQAETLDHLAANDPAAMRSRRDLARVHRAMGTRSIVARGWRALLPVAPAAAPLKVLELGAGDGTLLLGVARLLAPQWPRVQLSLLDRQDIVSPATLESYARIGWAVRVEVADVLDWAAAALLANTGGAAAAASAPAWDLITTSLFLHHFEAAELDALLAAVAARTAGFFACEPRRARLALAGSHLVGALGANAVTRHDAVASVHAGFAGGEISARWPGRSGDWALRESTAGLFSHCFSAQRRAPPAAPAGAAGAAE